MPNMETSPLGLPNKFGFSINESCELSGLGRTFLYKAIANGELIARKAGRRTIILPPDLEAYLRNLPETSEAA
jgi:excisionase family DNA binding protein